MLQINNCEQYNIYIIMYTLHDLYDSQNYKYLMFVFQTLSFANSEARGAYINILAGALGFAGAGASMAVSQMASRGVNIGTVGYLFNLVYYKSS